MKTPTPITLTLPDDTELLNRVRFSGTLLEETAGITQRKREYWDTCHHISRDEDGRYSAHDLRKAVLMAQALGSGIRGLKIASTLADNALEAIEQPPRPPAWEPDEPEDETPPLTAEAMSEILQTLTTAITTVEGIEETRRWSSSAARITQLLTYLRALRKKLLALP
jgi:hypothetical protein